MFSKGLSSAAVALAASTLVSAQTFTKCNPLKTSCPPDPAFGSDPLTCDFTGGLCNAFTEASGTSLTFGANGADFKIMTVSNAPTITSNGYIFFGRIDVEVQAAAGQGIVTSCVLQSDDLDEIDWEWVGGDNAQAQSNYFSKGDTSTYNRGAYHAVANPLGQVHTYSVEWTPAAVQWIIDGAVVRTLTYASASGGASFPQTPMQIKLGTWVAGGPNSPPGTVEWAGGYTQFNQAPFNAYYKSIKITDYAGGSSLPSSPIKEYVYGGDSGTYQSIKVVKGDGSSSNPSGSGSSSSTKKAKAPPSSTAAPTTKSKIQSAVISGLSATSTSAAATTTTAASSTSEARNTTMATSTTGAASTGTQTTTASPSQVTKGAAVNVAASFGSVVLAGAGVALAQLLF